MTSVGSPLSPVHLTVRMIPKSVTESTGTSGSLTASSQLQISSRDGKLVCISITIELGDKPEVGIASPLINNQEPPCELLVYRQFAPTRRSGSAASPLSGGFELSLTRPLSICSSPARPALSTSRYLAGLPHIIHRYKTKAR